MNKRIFAFLLMAFCLMLGFIPVTAQEAPYGFLVTVMEGAGNELTFDAPPQPIICGYTRCRELLAALEVVPVGSPVWIDSFVFDPDYFPQPNEIELIAGDSDPIVT